MKVESLKHALSLQAIVTISGDLKIKISFLGDFFLNIGNL
jgi:hypothetical protein